MEKINGREAVSILAELKAGKRDLEDFEVRYVKAQAMNFVTWLAEKAKIPFNDALERTRGIIQSEVKLLLQEDTFADFIWSRGDEVGDEEVLGFNGLDFEKSSNSDHYSDNEYWEKMERTAERNVGKYPDEVWAASREKRDQILEVLNTIKFSNELLGSSKMKVRLGKMNQRIRELRFGKSPILMYRHWAECQNLMNELLGNPKRYSVKEVSEKTEEEKIDALDNAVYGVLDNYSIYS